MRNHLLAALAVFALLAGCGGDDDGGQQRLGEGEDAVVLGGDVPDEFDLPLPEGTEFTYSDEETAYHFQVEMGPEEVAAFYETRLSGYELEGAEDLGLDASDEEFLLESMGGTINFDGGQLVLGAIEPEGTTALLFTLSG